MPIPDRAHEPRGYSADLARRRRWVRAVAWLTALLLAATAAVVARSTGAHAAELQPYVASDELEKALTLWPRLERGASLYRAQCAKCHGTQGWGSASDERTPALAGQHYQYLVKQLADLRRAEPGLDRGAFHVAALQALRDAQGIVDVAAHLSGLEPNRRPRVGPGNHVRLGGAAYQWLCQDCHKDGGEGDAILFTPRISAQHYPYLLQQLEDFAAGHRLNVPPELLGRAVALSGEERAALADYVSRLPVTEPRAVARTVMRSTQSRSP